MDALVAKSEMFQQKVNHAMAGKKFRFAHLLLNYYNNIQNIWLELFRKIFIPKMCRNHMEIN